MVILDFFKKFYRFLWPLSVEWSGDFPDCDHAVRACSVYSNAKISERWFITARNVMEGGACFSWDGAVFDYCEYN